jgi:hypothetical protein
MLGQKVFAFCLVNDGNLIFVYSLLTFERGGGASLTSNVLGLASALIMAPHHTP